MLCGSRSHLQGVELFCQATSLRPQIEILQAAAPMQGGMTSDDGLDFGFDFGQ